MKKYIILFILILFSNTFSQQSNNLQTFVSLKVRAITPIGVFSEDWETGGTVYLTYGWIYSDEWAVHLQAGYNKYRLKDNSDLKNSPKLTMIPFQVGGRYYILQGTIRPFLAAMTGINFLRYSYKLELNEVEESKVHLNWQTGLGVAYVLTNNLQIELSAMYNSHLINPSIPYNLTGYEYGIGINWIF
jgi:outer membrane protein W